MKRLYQNNQVNFENLYKTQPRAQGKLPKSFMKISFSSYVVKCEDLRVFFSNSLAILGECFPRDSLR